MDRTLTVTELSLMIKRKIEGSPDLTSIWVKGELSNVTYHSSGHIYFTLKDQNSIIQAAFFKNANRAVKFKLEEGLAVIVLGSVTIYEKRGNYQMIIADVMLEGVGELQKRIEQLKKTLTAEGIFEPSRKRKLPFLPKRVGVVTSPTGAAYRDILKVALRRYPTMEIILAPAKVQGDDAAMTIVRGIEELNNPKWNIDVIIVGRGGGSFEDLMPFNEEIVVRAFATSRIPIVSAVGHQIDHPLSDDAADVYAPTPSAAAELVVPVKADLVSEIDYYLARGDQALSKKLQHDRLKVESILSRRVFAEPNHIVYMKEIELSEFQNRMTFALKDSISIARDSLSRIPDIKRVFAQYFSLRKSSFAMLASTLQNLSPLAVMSRGFSVALDSQKKVVKSVTQVNTGDDLSVYISDGLIDCSVRKIQKGVSLGKEKENKED
jgi:exodeoxyribonuclease VII large subunit